MTYASGMTYGLFRLGLVLALLASAGGQQNSSATPTIKVRIEANQWDRDVILKKLNEHGADHALRFMAADEGYDYRVVFLVGQSTSTVYGSSSSLNSASAEVYDPQGTELFKVFRNNRFSEAGASNAVAKEIVKRLLKLRNSAKGQR